MGEASSISLKAIGKQDTYLLCKDPAESFFNPNTKRRHSDFRKYHRSRTILNPGQVPKWPFGQTIKVEYRPQSMGDLLSNMWLSITMPKITNGNYTDQLGRHILKSVTMFVDDAEIEKIESDWGIIYDELYLEMSEKVANSFLVNRSIGFDDSTIKDSVSRLDTDLIIPLQLFFARKFASDEYSSNKPNRPYFPVCAVHKQKIQFVLEFQDQPFFTDTLNTLALPEFKLVTEEITVSAEERNFLSYEKQVIVTDLVRKHPTTVSEIGKSIIRTNLVPNIPVKCLHWFLRNTKFENVSESVALQPRQLGPTISGTNTNDDSGYSVAMSPDGTTIAIGEPRYEVQVDNDPEDGEVDNPNENKGRVRVFRYVSGSWTQLGTDLIGAGVTNLFGTSVSLSNTGTALAVGGPGHDSNKGHVRVYQYNAGSWGQLGSDIDGTAGIKFGTSVSLSSNGTHVAIGGPYHNTNMGRVQVWSYSIGSGWTQLGGNMDGVGGGDLLGSCVSLSEPVTANGTDRVVAIGAPGHDASKGHLKAFVYNGSAWVQRGADIDGINSGDEFGTSVDISKDSLYLIGGAPKNDGGGTDSGQASVFYYSSAASAWGQIGPDINGLVAGEKAGTSVAITSNVKVGQQPHTGTRVAVGTPLSNRTRAYNYINVSNTPAWDRLHREMGGNGSGGSMSMSNDGLKMVVGSPTFNNNVGQTQVFDLPTNDEELYLCQNRFNFSSNVSFDDQLTFFHPILKDACFFINGTKLPNVTNTNHNYYKYLIPSRVRLARPIRNIYTYSFSMNPINVEPSGSLDFGEIQSDKTNIEVNLDTTKVDVSSNTYSLHMYYTGYQTLIFEEGRVVPATAY
tara:strand:- start:4852 stop:7389 length:2538 start_codon:yes stop_codon:yes gene_type:complete